MITEQEFDDTIVFISTLLKQAFMVAMFEEGIDPKVAARIATNVQGRLKAAEDSLNSGT